MENFHTINSSDFSNMESVLYKSPTFSMWLATVHDTPSQFAMDDMALSPILHTIWDDCYASLLVPSFLRIDHNNYCFS